MLVKKNKKVPAFASAFYEPYHTFYTSPLICIDKYVHTWLQLCKKTNQCVDNVWCDTWSYCASWNKVKANKNKFRANKQPVLYINSYETMKSHKLIIIHTGLGLLVVSYLGIINQILEGFLISCLNFRSSKADKQHPSAFSSLLISISESLQQPSARSLFVLALSHSFFSHAEIP